MNNYGNGGGGILNDYGGSGHWNSNGGGSGHWNSNGWNSPYNGRLTPFELVLFKKVQILGVLFSFIKMSIIKRSLHCMPLKNQTVYFTRLNL